MVADKSLLEIVWVFLHSNGYGHLWPAKECGHPLCVAVQEELGLPVAELYEEYREVYGESQEKEAASPT